MDGDVCGTGVQFLCIKGNTWNRICKRSHPEEPPGVPGDRSSERKHSGGAVQPYMEVQKRTPKRDTS